MEHRLIEFATRHWWLVALFFIILAMIIVYEIKNAANSNKTSPAQATLLMNREDAVILDIRNKESFEISHIINAIHIDANDIADNLKKLQKNKDKPIIICCQYGQDSVKVAATLKSNGFEKVHILAGGINAWQGANLPTVAEKK